MAAKLKLARELIPWSLVARGVLFAVAWLFLPYLLFLLAATFLFFSPPFQAGRFLPLFLFISWLALIFSPGVREAIFLSVLFVTALGIKNLVFVDRVIASQVFLTASSFLLWLMFFSSSPRPGFSFLIIALVLTLISFLLTRFMSQLAQPDSLAPTPLLLMALFSFLSFEMVWVLSLLPAAPVLQAVLMALSTAFFMELFHVYLSKTLSTYRLVVVSASFFVISFALLLFLPFSLTS